MLKLILPDGAALELPDGATCLDAARAISPGLARSALAATLDGAVVELMTPVTDGAAFSVLTDGDDALHTMRHTASHVMAQAVKHLYPDAKFAIGPAIDTGFYYDIECSTSFTPDDLVKIEAEMRKIVKEALPVERFTMPRTEALEYFKNAGEPYKVELIQDLPEDAVISFYRQGDFTDLCAGPHLPDTGRVKAFTLTSVAGAYWRGDSTRPMLQRIYGAAFLTKDALDAHLTMLEEAKKRDHRRLGRELDLFDVYEEGPGFPFFLPKGMILRNLLEQFWREKHQRAGYQEIRTPIILNEQLWHRSGHWDHYKDAMYFTTIDDTGYAVKPMNCPGGMLVYMRKPHSYRELPLRMAELGLVHRHELSGALHGLLRVRNFTQDDAHIFMTPEQVEDELIGVVELIDEFYDTFGFSYAVELSTRPESFMGEIETWDMAEATLERVIKRTGKAYKINPGDGAFYGPKLDFHVTDAIGRTWQLATVQLDFQMPERFQLEYIGPDGAAHRPVMIHRVVFGALERFIAILTEHTAGAFPAWLAPVQVKVLPITDRTQEYAEGINQKLGDLGLRSEVDLRSEKIGYKIREAQLQKVPYMLVVGDREAEDNIVAVRDRRDGSSATMTLEDFVGKIRAEIDSKAL